MDDPSSLVLRVAGIGAGATLVLDLWLVFLRRALRVATMDFALLGRWLGHVPQGRWFHPAGMARAAPVRGERAWGWLLHYAVGVAFAALLVLWQGPQWLGQPTALPALAAGAATVAAPLLVLQPAMGQGLAARKTATPWANRARNLANHTVFGLGLFLSARLLAHLFA